MDLTNRVRLRRTDRRENAHRGTTNLLRGSCRPHKVPAQGLCMLEHQINGSDLLIWRVFVSLEERLDLEAEFRPDVLLELPVDGGVTSEHLRQFPCHGRQHLFLHQFMC